MEQWLNGNNTWNSNPDNMASGMSSTWHLVWQLCNRSSGSVQLAASERWPFLKSLMATTHPTGSVITHGNGHQFAVQSDLWTSTVPCTKLHTLTCHWFWILSKSRPCPKQILCKTHGLELPQSPCRSARILVAVPQFPNPRWPGFHGIQAISSRFQPPRNHAEMAK
jgi:hypothetical protein